jgi:hypothetical protein
MTDTGSGAHPGGGDAPPPQEPTAAAPRRPALWLAAVLGVVIAAVAAAPFWAPPLIALLPWGAEPAVSATDLAGLTDRVTALEKQAGASTAALSRRVDQLEAAQRDKAADAAKLDGLTRRLDDLEKRSGAFDKLQQEVARLGAVAADLADRLPALEKELHAKTETRQTDAPLALVMLRIREAIDEGRPFASEYAALSTMIAGNPDLAGAAAPLAEAAQSGVASRPVLVKHLDELSGQIAVATPSPAASDWGAQALARLRGLVTIRRLDGAAPGGPEAAVAKAQRALAAGDLAGAVDALAALAGANAEKAAPWLRMAGQRLAVDTALSRLQLLLMARVGGGAPS